MYKFQNDFNRDTMSHFIWIRPGFGCRFSVALSLEKKTKQNGDFGPGQPVRKVGANNVVLKRCRPILAGYEVNVFFTHFSHGV